MSGRILGHHGIDPRNDDGKLLKGGQGAALFDTRVENEGRRGEDSDDAPGRAAFARAVRLDQPPTTLVHHEGSSIMRSVLPYDVAREGLPPVAQLP